MGSMGVSMVGSWTDGQRDTLLDFASVRILYLWVLL
jgi:hypothetical protein